MWATAIRNEFQQFFVQLFKLNLSCNRWLKVYGVVLSAQAQLEHIFRGAEGTEILWVKRSV